MIYSYMYNAYMYMYMYVDHNHAVCNTRDSLNTLHCTATDYSHDVLDIVHPIIHVHLH